MTQKGRRFKSWVTLNQEGRKIYGHIYPQGMIPVESMIPEGMQLEDPQTGALFLERCYKVCLPELTEEQLEKTLDMFERSMRGRIPREKIREEIHRIGLPIRARYVSSSGTDNSRLFT